MTAPDHTSRAERDDAECIDLHGGCHLTRSTRFSFAIHMPNGKVIGELYGNGYCHDYVTARAFAAALQPAAVPASEDPIVPVAWMARCGPDDVRMWRASRLAEAMGCAREFGVPLVSLYSADQIAERDARIAALESENAALREVAEARTVPAELRALSERATPGPWEDDCLTVREDGERYDARQAIDQSGKTLFDSSNSEVQTIEHDYDGEGLGSSWDEQGERNIKFAVEAGNYVRALIASDRAGAN